MSLLDATAAAYADVDEVRIVGLVDSDWPERGRRSIFYPPSLLAQLGWPVDADRLSAARARFHDLLRLPRRACRGVAVHARRRRDRVRRRRSRGARGRRPAGGADRPNSPLCGSSLHEALALEPLVASAVGGQALEWLALRASRSAALEPQFHGAAGAQRNPACTP